MLLSGAIECHCSHRPRKTWPNLAMRSTKSPLETVTIDESIRMPRNFIFVAALAGVLLLPAGASADPVDGMRSAHAAGKRGKLVKTKKRAVRHQPTGYGFLPGYRPPPPQNPYLDHGYRPEGRYWYRGQLLYGYGGPGFIRNRWNGGSIGPCWKWTPIGLMWICG